MKTPEQIITEIKTFISSSKPFRFSGSETTVLNLLTELENTLNPQPIVERVIIEEPVVEEVVEETVIEDFDITSEEIIVEEPTVEETVTEEPVAKTTKKSKK
jgi:hypothetical protein